jgi:hypothetical protein
VEEDADSPTAVVEVAVEVVVEVVGREGRQGRRDCGRREMGLGLGLDEVLYTDETR